MHGNNFIDCECMLGIQYSMEGVGSKVECFQIEYHDEKIQDGAFGYGWSR